jgi:hypothetical protein
LPKISPESAAQKPASEAKRQKRRERRLKKHPFGSAPAFVGGAP